MTRRCGHLPSIALFSRSQRDCAERFLTCHSHSADIRSPFAKERYCHLTASYSQKQVSFTASPPSSGTTMFTHTVLRSLSLSRRIKLTHASAEASFGFASCATRLHYHGRRDGGSWEETFLFAPVRNGRLIDFSDDFSSLCPFFELGLLRVKAVEEGIF